MSTTNQAKRERTKTPGVYRRGKRYDVSYRDADRQQRWRSARTYEEARRLKRELESSLADGSYSAPTQVAVAEWFREWIERHHGSNGRGFTEDTRNEYRRDLERYLVPFLGRRRLSDVRRGDAKAFVAWLINDAAQVQRHRAEIAGRERVGKGPLRTPRPLSDATVRGGLWRPRSRVFRLPLMKRSDVTIRLPEFSFRKA